MRHRGAAVRDHCAAVRERLAGWEAPAGRHRGAGVDRRRRGSGLGQVVRLAVPYRRGGTAHRGGTGSGSPSHQISDLGTAIQFREPLVSHKLLHQPGRPFRFIQRLTQPSQDAHKIPSSLTENISGHQYRMMEGASPTNLQSILIRTLDEFSINGAATKGRLHASLSKKNGAGGGGLMVISLGVISNVVAQPFPPDCCGCFRFAPAVKVSVAYFVSWTRVASYNFSHIMLFSKIDEFLRLRRIIVTPPSCLGGVGRYGANGQESARPSSLMPRTKR